MTTDSHGRELFTVHPGIRTEGAVWRKSAPAPTDADQAQAEDARDEQG